MLKLNRILFATLLALAPWAGAAAASGPSGFSYEGRLYSNTGVPSALPVQFILEIYNPTATCLLRREQTATVDLSQTDGYFSVTVGQGAAMAGDPGLPMGTVFANAGAITGNSCSYTPVTGDGRVLKVSVYDGTTTTAMSPNISIGAAPYAVVADTVQGKAPADFIQVNSTTAKLTQANLESVFGTTAQVTTLQGLASGAGYMASSATAGTVVPGLASAPGSPVAGQFWYDTGSNTLKYFDGTSTQSLGGGGGTVTSITAGTGLNGGTIASSGTISLSNVGTAGTYFKVTTDAQGRVTSGTGLVAGDVTSALGYTALNKTGDTMSGGLVLPANGLTLGTTQLVTSGGNVGVGTSSPGSNLHVLAPSATATVMVESQNTTSNSQVALKNSSAQQYNLMVGGSSGSYPNKFVVFDWTAAAARLTITSAGNVGIGTTSPGTLLEVANGDIKANGLIVGRGNGGLSANSAFGVSALTATTGDYNTALGYWALSGNTSGTDNVGVGTQALQMNTTGNTNTAVGRAALMTNTTGTANTAVGWQALYAATSTSNTAIGRNSLVAATTGGSNTAVGANSGSALTTGANNVLLGTGAGSAITTGNYNVVLGSNTGSTIATSSNVILISDGSGTERMRLGTGGVGIGTTSPGAALDVAGTVKLGTAGLAVTSMGACTITSFAIAAGANAKTCTGLPVGAAVSCSPSASPGTTVTWGAFASGAGTVTINSSVGGTSATWYCMWVQP